MQDRVRNRRDWSTGIYCKNAESDISGKTRRKAQETEITEKRLCRDSITSRAGGWLQDGHIRQQVTDQGACCRSGNFQRPERTRKRAAGPDQELGDHSLSESESCCLLFDPLVDVFL